MPDLRVDPNHLLVFEGRDEGKGMPDRREQDVSPWLVGLGFDGKTDVVPPILRVLAQQVDALGLASECVTHVLRRVGLCALATTPEDVRAGSKFGGQI